MSQSEDASLAYMTASMAADKRYQGIVGIALASAVLLGYVALHVFAIYFYPWQGIGLWLSPLLVAALCWFYVALFIIAHDAMHGTIAPSWPAVNPLLGRVALMLYGGFPFAAMRKAHRLHHKHAGTAQDPDFDPHRVGPDSDPNQRVAFWPWYLHFMSTYASAEQFLFLFAATAFYIATEAPYQNLLIFWALPLLLSSMQLFVFGTYLPHHPDENEPFADRHRARSLDVPWIVSFLTCLHFSYHHEHHSHPGVPWWRLPNLRLRRRR